MGIFDFLKKKKDEVTEESELLVEEGIKETSVLSEESENQELEEVKEEIKENEVFDNIKKEVEEAREKDEIKTIDYIETLNKAIEKSEIAETIEKIEEETIEEVEEEAIEEVEEEAIEEIEEETIEEVVEEAIKEIEEETIEEIEEEAIEEIEEEAIEEIEEEAIEENVTEKKLNLFQKFKKGLVKTKDSIVGGLDSVLGAFTKIDEELFEELEETLIMSDLGVETSVYIIDKLRESVKKEGVTEVSEVRNLIVKIISEILEENNEVLIFEPPTIILVIGVNGVGKTTTIGKLTHKFVSEGKSVQLAAADTFRAAAIDQLQVWADRNKVPLIKHQENGDPGAVVFDAVKSAKARKTDILIIDTAGRLHNKKNLMEELKKINRIIEREYSEANLEVFLALDSTTGQNAMEQAKQFNEVTNITGLVLTKLDGTAKGGIIVSIKNELDVPVRFVGIGEQIDDLEVFDSATFAKALFEE